MRPNLTRPSILQSICLPLGLALFVYNIVRVLNVPITYDEALTHMFYTWDFNNTISAVPAIANNHILNSLLTTLSIKYFDHSIFFVRLPNVLAHILYLGYSYHLCKMVMGRGWWSVALFALLNLNPFFFDFWGLCRGYGLASAFMLSGIVHLIHSFNSRKYLHLVVSLMFGALSVYSNFATLNYYVAVVGVVLLLTPRSPLRNYLKSVVCIGAVSAILAIVIVRPLARINAAKEFYYGGDKGIVQDTIYSLVRESLFTTDLHATALMVISVMIAVLGLAVAVYWMYTFLAGEKTMVTRAGLSFSMLLVLPVLSIEAQHLLFGTKYLIERTALFFYPLFIIALVYTLYHLRSKATVFAGLTVIFAVAAGINFLRHVNTTFARSWPKDKYLVAIIQKIIRDNPSKKSAVDVHWLFHPGMVYYADFYFRQNIGPVNMQSGEVKSDSVSGPDYVYTMANETPVLPSYYILDTAVSQQRIVLYKKVLSASPVNDTAIRD